MPLTNKQTVWFCQHLESSEISGSFLQRGEAYLFRPIKDNIQYMDLWILM